MLLAQDFVDRIVGLRTGEVVFDGPPSALSPEVLTRIYGEEDWAALQRGQEREEESGAGDGEDRRWRIRTPHQPCLKPMKE